MCDFDDNCMKYNQSATATVNEGNKKYCTCMECKADYYISNGRCTANPSIDNCKTYSEGKCSVCNDNYYINSENKCSENTATNCLTKSKTSNTCATCDSTQAEYNYFKEGKCITVNIPNCEKFASENRCEVCKVGYGLNFNKAKCLNNSPGEDGGTENCFIYSDDLNSNKKP